MIDYTCIKRKAEELLESVKEFDSSEYFTLNYKETGKFSFTIACLGIALFGTTMLVKKLINDSKK